MDYQRGLAALRKLAEGTNWFTEVLLFEARLLENLDDERRYGSTEQYRATRAQIIYELNHLAYDHVGRSFNDLCRDSPRQPPGVPASIPALQKKSQQPQQKTDPTDNTTRSLRTNVFIGHSHQDTKYLAELHAHLKPYVRSGAIKVWDDTMIPLGAKWREEIEHAIEATKVAVLLISVHFLASDFIASHELPPLLRAAEQEQVKILCVILGPCNFEATELAQFQAINAPSKPLGNMTRGKREEVWMQAVKYVNDMVLDQ